jgi:hypothetical protein
MKFLAKNDAQHLKSDEFTEHFRQILLENLPVSREQLATFDACYQEYMKFLDDLNTKSKNFANFNHFSKVSNVMSQM